MQNVIATVFLLSASLQGEPLFPNSVVSNDIDFIRTTDPSESFQIMRKGRERKEMPDKRSDELFLDGVFTFLVQFEDGSSVEAWASPEIGDGTAAEKYVRLLGAALGKQPQVLREKLHHVVIHGGDETAYAEEEGHFFVVYKKNIEKRISTHDLEETVFHECIHATLEADHATSAGWIAAQKKDPGFITAYAKKNPRKEDLPESALFAYTLIHFPGRLSAEHEARVRETMPNRLQYLEALFSSFGKKAGRVKGVE